LATQRYLEQPSLTPLYGTLVGRRSAYPALKSCGITRLGDEVGYALRLADLERDGARLSADFYLNR
jgi:hypothetical protein